MFLKCSQPFKNINYFSEIHVADEMRKQVNYSIQRRYINIYVGSTFGILLFIFSNLEKKSPQFYFSCESNSMLVSFACPRAIQNFQLLPIHNSK